MTWNTALPSGPIQLAEDIRHPTLAVSLIDLGIFLTGEVGMYDRSAASHFRLG